MNKEKNKDIDNIIKILKDRFNEKNLVYLQISWEDIKNRINNKNIIESILYMEETNGEPSIISYDSTKNKYIIYDTSIETPNRRSLCYDRKAFESRKKYKPEDDILSVCKKYNLVLLDEYEYRKLQNIFAFDLKTSSWIKTPNEIRNLGGALFCDRRYNHVFTYHNSAESYYSSRGFRVKIEV